MNFLIHTLLKSSQLENGIIHLHREYLPINNTILSSIEEILLSADKKNVKITYNNSKDYLIPHDSRWLSEAIFNILDNSIKYTPTNGEISISIFKTEDQLGICISDTGIGISKYNLNNIFNRFWRENRIVTDGNGLGLYLCKEIISLHDGYIIVESEKNCGTTTKIFLPFYYNK